MVVLQRSYMLALRMKILGLLSALLLACSAGPVARPSYHCHISGQVSKSCCCATKHKSQGEPQATPASCCDLVQSAQVSTTTVVPDDAPLPLPAAVFAHGDGHLRLRLSELPRAPQHALPHARPPGPARFLANCSWLI